ncbi:MAG: hypothetical protein ABI347_05410 [Nitrososphaera sp.]
MSATAKTKKTNVTIALDDYIFKEIRKEAEDSRQSLNALVSNVLRKHINFYRTAELTGVVIVPPNVFQFFINETDEGQFVKEMTKAGTDLVPSFFAQKGIPLTFENIVKISFEEVAVRGGVIRSVSKYLDKQDGKTCLFFRHDFNIKWSRILSAAFSYHIEHLLHYHTTSKIFSNSVELKILEQNP